MAKDEQDDGAIPQDTVDRMMMKCGRRCCICRRFRPLRLQVHHIVDRSKGGTIDEDNLIVTCQTCHSDVHSHVPFMRRFTEAELKGHRAAVIRLVSEGTLPATDVDDTDEILALIARIAGRNQQPVTELMPEAKETLVIACSADGDQQGKIVLSFDGTGWVLACANKSRRIPHQDRIGQARCKKALEQLSECKLIEDTGRKSWPGGNLIAWYATRYEGYLVADELLAAEAALRTTET